MDNKHNEAIPEPVLADAQEKIRELVKMLSPYLINLTATERQNILKMGDKTLGFAAKSYDYAQANSSFVPSYLDMDAFRIDMKDATGLRVLEITLLQLVQGVDDTIMLAGSEAYNQALVFYNSVKQAARQEIPGAKAIYNELQSRFPGRRTKKDEQ